MKLKVETGHELDGSWYVKVNGVKHLRHESWAIAELVADHLRHPELSFGPSECREVADSIRKTFFTIND